MSSSQSSVLNHHTIVLSLNSQIFTSVLDENFNCIDFNIFHSWPVFPYLIYLFFVRIILNLSLWLCVCQFYHINLSLLYCNVMLRMQSHVSLSSSFRNCSWEIAHPYDSPPLYEILFFSLEAFRLLCFSLHF